MSAPAHQSDTAVFINEFAALRAAAYAGRHMGKTHARVRRSGRRGGVDGWVVLYRDQLADMTVAMTNSDLDEMHDMHGEPA